MARAATVTKRRASRPAAGKTTRSGSKTAKKTRRKTADSSPPPRRSVSASKKGAEKPIRTYANALEFLNSLINYERRPPARREKKALESASVACWRKYKEIYGSADQATIERDLMGLVADYADKLIRGLHRSSS